MNCIYPSRWHSPFAVFFACLLLPAVSPAATFIENFDDGAIDPTLTVQLDPGFTMTLVGGEVVMQKAAGTLSGTARIVTDFEVLGDFTASVDAARVDLTSFADMGLLSRHPVGSGQFLDVFFNDQTKIIGNFFVGPSQSTATVNTGVSPVTFQIQRVGQTITIGYVFNGGFVFVASSSGSHLAGPATIQIFLEQFNGFGDSHTGRFDNLEIIADAFDHGSPAVPIASTRVLEIAAVFIALAGAWTLNCHRRLDVRV